MSTTDYTHPEYAKFAPLWTKVRDACAGEEAVKSKGTAYLPDPGEVSNDDHDQRRARYRAYLRRAVYYNATGRTLQSLVGVAYANWPRVAIPEPMSYLLQDADGTGVGIINQSQSVLAEVLQTGRAGILADYSEVDETQVKRPISIAEATRAGRRANVAIYNAESILTWEYQGSTLSRLVLRESAWEYAGGEAREIPQLRELVLRDGQCMVRLWQKLRDGGDYMLVKSKPTTFRMIPFQFIGATNNDATPDQPPLLDLANLNLAHFRNSADFEESAFLVGQPQLVVAGVDQEWVDRMGSICFGARSALPLPQGASADLLQAQPNTLAEKAMGEKERMMAALGARLLANDMPVKTATQSASETKAAYSVLSLACDNVSDAYTRALRWAVSFDMGNRADLDKVEFAIDTRFNDLTLDANAIRETVAAWQAGLVPQSDAWGVLRRLGVVDQGKSDEQIRQELDAQGPSLDLDEAA